GGRPEPEIFERRKGEDLLSGLCRRVEGEVIDHRRNAGRRPIENEDQWLVVSLASGQPDTRAITADRNVVRGAAVGFEELGCWKRLHSGIRENAELRATK